MTEQTMHAGECYESEHGVVRIISVDSDPRCNVWVCLESDPDQDFMVSRSALGARKGARCPACYEIATDAFAAHCAVRGVAIHDNDGRIIRHSCSKGGK